MGIAVYNTAYALIGDFTETALDRLFQVVDVKIRGPLIFAHTLAPAMQARGRGGLILMGSLSGLQGRPHLDTYAASKALNVVLAEPLWHELKPVEARPHAHLPGHRIPGRGRWRA